MKRTLAVVLLLAATLSAQPRLDETIEVSIVNVDVIVTDRSGKRVTGLTVADFELREAGKLQPITNFAEYTPPAPGSVSIESAPGTAAPASVIPPRTPRTVVIFMEIVRLPPFQAKEMFDSIRELLRKTVAPGDRVAIITWMNGMVVRQPYTDDRTTLERALATLEADHVRGPRELAREIRRQQAESDRDAAEMEASSGMPPVHALDAAQRQLAQIRQKTVALEALMQSISGLEGRKIVIMAMRRFGVTAGVEYFGGTVPLEYQRELDTSPLRASLVRSANAHGITLYPVYAPGIRWEPDDASTAVQTDDLERGALQNSIMINETTALSDVAVKTGGLMAWGSANIAEILPRVAEDLEAYYSLGYRSRGTGKDVTRDIVVKTKNPEYNVRSRRQFVEKSDQSQMNDRVTANLFDRIGGSSIPVLVTFGQLKSIGRKRWSVPIKVRVPIAALMSRPEGRVEAGEFSVYVVTGSSVGVMSEVQRRSQPFRIPLADLQKAKTSHFTYDLTLQVDAAADRISVGVLDEVSKQFGLNRFMMPERPAK